MDVMSVETTRALTCFHMFHTDCISQWERENNTCPVCRTFIDEQRPADESNTDTWDTETLSNGQYPYPALDYSSSRVNELLFYGAPSSRAGMGWMDHPTTFIEYATGRRFEQLLNGDIVEMDMRNPRRYGGLLERDLFWLDDFIQDLTPNPNYHQMGTIIEVCDLFNVSLSSVMTCAPPLNAQWNELLSYYNTFADTTSDVMISIMELKIMHQIRCNEINRRCTVPKLRDMARKLDVILLRIDNSRRWTETYYEFVVVHGFTHIIPDDSIHNLINIMSSNPVKDKTSDKKKKINDQTRKQLNK